MNSGSVSASSNEAKNGFVLGGASPKDKNAHLLATPPAGSKTKKQRKAAEERNCYTNWSLLVDKATNPDCDYANDSGSESGASTIADFDEEDSERMGFELFKKTETAQECLKRWLAVLDLAKVMLDNFPFEVKCSGLVICFTPSKPCYTMSRALSLESGVWSRLLLILSFGCPVASPCTVDQMR